MPLAFASGIFLWCDMQEIFLISDTHFGHANICQFLRDSGEKLRPFDNVEDMDNCMIEKWNQTIRPKDKVYHLGDVAINRKSLNILEKLNGEKVLIKGNHDIFKLNDYSKHFKDIRAMHFLCKCLLLTHVPIHECSMKKNIINVHGHLHYRRVLNHDGIVNPSYLNVCVELTDYAPMHFEIARKLALEQV